MSTRMHENPLAAVAPGRGTYVPDPVIFLMTAPEIRQF